jgi:DNA-binding CsgD family transcriptional regulator
MSPREKECLQWAAGGKTIWETSRILKISERAVRLYLDIARHKLECLNKTQAVAKAVALGIVEYS